MEHEIYLLDGSQSMQLAHYIDPNPNHPLWVCKYLFENPDIVKIMHEDYLHAGSDIISTLTYQVSVDGLVQSYNLSIEEAEQIIYSSVEIVKTAWESYKNKTGSKKKHIISGSIGPYGAFLRDGSEYTGDYGLQLKSVNLIDFHRPRVKILLDSGVDFLCFETLPSMEEALAVVQLLREFPNAKAWISFTCKNEKMTAKGEDFGKCVAECWNKCRNQNQLIAVGCNCTNPDFVSDLLKSAKREISEPVPFVTYSNSGEIYGSNGWTGERQDLGSFIPEWLSTGVKYVGGCCRTDVRDIRRIRQVLNKPLFDK